MVWVRVRVRVRVGVRVSVRFSPHPQEVVVEAEDGLAHAVVAAEGGVEQQSQLVGVQRRRVAQAVGYRPGLRGRVSTWTTWVGKVRWVCRRWSCNLAVALEACQAASDGFGPLPLIP